MFVRRKNYFPYGIIALVCVGLWIVFTLRSAKVDNIFKREMQGYSSIAPNNQQHLQRGGKERDMDSKDETTQHSSDANLLSESLHYLADRILKNGHFRTDAELTPRCHKEQRNFVYIKNHKCSSNTMSAMFRRFGYERNLSMVLPVEKRYNIGWPDALTPSMYRASKSGDPFSVLVEHTVYNEKLLSRIMRADTVYVTSIREPLARMKSAFFFFGVEKIANITFMTADPDEMLKIYLRNPQMYDDRFVAPNPRVVRPCVPDGLSVLRNAMAFDLGFPTGYHENTVDQQLNLDYITSWLQYIDHTFDVVLLVDHYMESLVMLKRTMCWNFKDILFKNFSPINPNKQVRRTLPSSLVDGYHLWSFVDYVLHEHFRRVLWRKIDAMGLTDFMLEVADFKQTLEKVVGFCDGVDRSGKDEQVHFAGSKWNTAAFVVSRTDCEHISSDMRQELRDQYDSTPGHVQQPVGAIKGC